MTYEFRMSTPSTNESIQPRKVPQPNIFVMYPLGSSYTDNIPPQKPFEKENLSHTPKIPQKNAILQRMEKMFLSDPEPILNWQSKNCHVQKQDAD